MAANAGETMATSAETPAESRFQTDNSVSTKQHPKQQLSKAMEHMRFAVTVDPIPHPSTKAQAPSGTPSGTPSETPSETARQDATAATTESTENDAYGVPASFAPVRNPAARSHDPSNNQKRTDPFAFGSRFLEEGDNIFEFNAWDHVTVDDSYLQFSEEQYERQRQDPVSEFDRKRFNDNPERWWNTFYKNNKTNFFKNRKWLAQEFPILEELGKEDAPEAVLLEVGAGAGNSAFPILQTSRNKRLKIHACDFSKKAVELIRDHELYDPQFIQADVWDVASSPDSENGGLPPGLKENSVDVVLMIFIFSALNPKQWDQAVRNVWRVLKPGGQVLFRDYGRGDLAQVRFKKGRWMEENFYVRGDGTRVYFFEQDELEEIWGGKKRTESNDANTGSNGGPDDALAAKIESLHLGESSTEAANESAKPQDPRPTFEVVHFGVDRRMLVNRQRRLKMYRCWMQAVFRKAGHQSEIPTSTIRQDKDSAEEKGEDA